MSQTSGGYDPAFFAKLDIVEDRHFWFRARKRVVGAMIRQLAEEFPSGYNVLELGCGNGGMLRLLQESCAGGRVFGMDLFPQALANASHRSSCPLVLGDVHLSPFSEAFHLVGMFDVLEHIDDDLTVLRDVRTMLVPGGALLLTVPAHMSLWSYFDEAAHHARRYTPEVLAERLCEAGFEVDYQTQFMSAIFPLVWLGRRVNEYLNEYVIRRTHGAYDKTSSEFRIVPGLNGLLDWSLSGEAEMIRHRRRISLGTSLMAVARKCRAKSGSNGSATSARKISGKNSGN
jgi:SAM-dependent methyltransferase